MKSHPDYSDEEAEFWAYIKLISNKNGYVSDGSPKRYTERDILHSSIFDEERENINNQIALDGIHREGLNQLGSKIKSYFDKRADVVEEALERVQTYEEAVKNFERKGGNIDTVCFSDDSSSKSVFESSVNLVVENNYSGDFNHSDPGGSYTVLTDSDSNLEFVIPKESDGKLETEDYVYNWEVKEYYENKEYGSRIEDTVYIMGYIESQIKRYRNTSGKKRY